MRKLATIQRIVKLDPIPDADRILKATILGWECVVGTKDNFKPNELVVYIEVDSVVPERPEFEFLRERKFRIRTIRLKKQTSQGLVLPLSILPNKVYNEGDDVTDILGIKKYDPEGELEQKLIDEKVTRNKNKVVQFLARNSWFRRLFFPKKKDRGWPKFIKKTDEDRIQLFPNICEKEKDTIFQVTEKLDGQSGTFFLVKNPKKFLWFGEKYIFGVCSRNLYLKKEDNSSYWTIARNKNIKKVLESLIGDADYVVLQGEILGTGIQANKYKIDGYDFFAFNLIYPVMQMDNLGAKMILEHLGINFVPLLDENFKLKSTIPEMVDFAKGKSKIANIDREGIVCRNYDKNLSFKVINPDFLLKFDEK
jgi:hypothetical protein